MLAYNVVAASGSATTEVATKKKKTEWPSALKIYVGKAFENVEDEDRPALETHLKTMITQAFESNSVWTTDWTKEPLPIMSSQRSFKDKWESLQPDSPSSAPSMGGSSPNLALGKRKKSRFDVVKTSEADRPADSEEQKAKRARRFENLSLKPSPVPVERTNAVGFSEGVPDYDEHTIIGHATKLEKSYLRLTSAPDPSTVRPLHVLKDTLELLKQKWKEAANYAYICDQFKSLRQDLTVQRIKNEFTINVYEIHARIALERSDLGEYNQCQTQLQSLYLQMPNAGHPLEFLAYRILYMLHTRNLTEINTVLVNLTPKQRLDSNIAHALSVRKAMACANYPRIFRLYMEAPNMSGYLMDNFVDRERISALAIICKSYRPTLPLDQDCAKVLGFADVEELKEFLIRIGGESLTSSIIAMPENNQAGKEPKETVYMLTTPEAFTVFEAKLKLTNRVDIKGQI